MIEKPSFESQITFLTELINRRKPNWQLSTLSFEDVSQIILIRLFSKWKGFKPEKGPLENWANTVISNAIINLLRDNYFKHARPCVAQGGCSYAIGTNGCLYTKSKIQCNECPLFKRWQEKKESQHNIKSALPMENHQQEVHSKFEDSVDIERAKKIIDEKIKIKLSARERKIYKLLYINNLTPTECAKHLKNEDLKLYQPESYAKILEFQRKVISLSKQIIYDEDICN